eukprot:2942825-Pyramimonas_sp.AAC.1
MAASARGEAPLPALHHPLAPATGRWAWRRAAQGWPPQPPCASDACDAPALHSHCHAEGRTSKHAACRPRSPPTPSCRRRGGAPQVRCHGLPWLRGGSSRPREGQPWAANRRCKK